MIEIKGQPLVIASNLDYKSLSESSWDEAIEVAANRYNVDPCRIKMLIKQVEKMVAGDL